MPTEKTVIINIGRHEWLGLLAAFHVLAFADAMSEEDRRTFADDLRSALVKPRFHQHTFIEFVDWGATLDNYLVPDLVSHIQTERCKADEATESLSDLMSSACRES